MTEKNYNQQQQTMKTMQKQEVAATQKIESAPVKKEEKETSEDKKIEEAKTEEKKEEKKTIRKKEIVKKDEAVVNGVSLPISTKDSVAVCRFIKGKTIEKAIADLEEVLKFKKAIPMKGEIPHRKGKGMMSGRYPVKPVENFIIMLKNLRANAIVNGLEEGIITEAVPNRASRPYGRFGSIKRKRTHVRIRVAEKKIKSKAQEKKN
jgi:ribosomal protein L22